MNHTREYGYAFLDVTSALKWLDRNSTDKPIFLHRESERVWIGDPPTSDAGDCDELTRMELEELVPGGRNE